MIVVQVIVNSEFGRGWDLEATVLQVWDATSFLPGCILLHVSCYVPKTNPQSFLFYLKQSGVFWCSQHTSMEHPIFSCTYIQMQIKIIQEGRKRKNFLKEIPLKLFFFFLIKMTQCTSLPHNVSALVVNTCICQNTTYTQRPPAACCYQILDNRYVWKQWTRSC